MDRSKIEWTDATWNPIRGCTPVSDGCRNCYAARMAHRSAKPGMPFYGLADWRGGRAVFNGTIRVVESALDQPLRWKRPRRIFVNSMSDLFHENVDFRTVDEVFAVMEDAKWHTFQVLTKRPDRMARYLANVEPKLPPLPNVWLGVSVEDQKAADERIPLLLQCPAAVRFLSCEPLLGPVDLTWLPDGSWYDREGAEVYDALKGHAFYRDGEHGLAGGPRLSWVIAGGESGPCARPMHPEWARSLRDQCAAAGVPFLFKQWGEWGPMAGVPPCAPGITAGHWHRFDSGHCVKRVGKKAAGRFLDGRTHDDFPAAT